MYVECIILFLQSSIYQTASLKLDTKGQTANFGVNMQCLNRPDKLEDIVDEVGTVITAQGCVTVLQQLDNRVPPLACIMNHVVTTHVHVELHPVYLFWQEQDI